MNKMSQRDFVSGSTVAALSFNYFPNRLFGPDAPSNKFYIAGISVGGMGASNLQASKGENITALCDVESKYAEKSFSKYPNAETSKGCRFMLEKGKDIDAVIIATPDHTQAVITMAAIEAGKHVFG